MTHQMEALNWLIGLYNIDQNGILADQMGLGKTIEVISLFAYLYEYKGNQGPHLVVCPLSVVNNWKRELDKWLPDLRSRCLYATEKEREKCWKDVIDPRDFDIIITSFEGMKKSLNKLKKFTWDYFVIDEAHKLKNAESQFFEKSTEIKTLRTQLLTGTPLQNNIRELWSQLHLLMPKQFCDNTLFTTIFEEKDDENDGKDKQSKEDKQAMIKKLHMILRPFMLRRIKQDVEEISLPPKKEIYLYVGWSKLQRQVYKNLILYRIPNPGFGKKDRPYQNMVMQMRKIAIHPYLFPGVEDENSETFGDHLIENSGKFKMLDKLLHKLFANGHRCLIFSQFVIALNVVEDYCIYSGWKFCRIDGNVGLEEREEQVADFCSQDDKGDYNTDKFLFLVSTRAGGLGLNQVAADTVIILDSDWNPQVDLQAMDRSHRIGQTKPVNVYRLITKYSLEEKIQEKAMMKLKFDYMLLHKGRASVLDVEDKSLESEKLKELINNNPENFSKKELNDIAHYGASKIFNLDDEDEIEEEDIDKLLERGQELAIEKNKLIEDKIKVLTDLEGCTFDKIEPAFFYKDQYDAEVALNEEAISIERGKAKNDKGYTKSIEGQYNQNQIKDVHKKTRLDFVTIIDRNVKFSDWQLFDDLPRIKVLLEIMVNKMWDNGKSGYKWLDMNYFVKRWLEVCDDVEAEYRSLYRADVKRQKLKMIEEVEQDSGQQLSKKQAETFQKRVNDYKQLEPLDIRQGRVEFEDCSLSDNQQIELSSLLRSGFVWKYQTHLTYFKTLEKHGRNAVDKLAEALLKSKREIEEYTMKFLLVVKGKRNQEDAKNFESKLQKIHKGDLKATQNLIIEKIQNEKVRIHGASFDEIELPKDFRDNVSGEQTIDQILTKNKPTTKHREAMGKNNQNQVNKATVVADSKTYDVNKSKKESKKLPTEVIEISQLPVHDQFIMYCFGLWKIKFDDFGDESSTENPQFFVRKEIRNHKILDYDHFIKIINEKEMSERFYKKLIPAFCKDMKIDWIFNNQNNKKYQRLQISDQDSEEIWKKITGFSSDAKKYLETPNEVESSEDDGHEVKVQVEGTQQNDLLNEAFVQLNNDTMTTVNCSFLMFGNMIVQDEKPVPKKTNLMIEEDQVANNGQIQRDGNIGSAFVEKSAPARTIVEYFRVKPPNDMVSMDKQLNNDTQVVKDKFSNSLNCHNLNIGQMSLCQIDSNKNGENLKDAARDRSLQIVNKKSKKISGNRKYE